MKTQKLLDDSRTDAAVVPHVDLGDDKDGGWQVRE